MVVVPAANALPKPAQLTWEEAGSYGLVTGTAHRMLRRSRLSKGDLLLVVGIGGGVAAATFSLGLALGAEVHVTSTDPAKREWAMANGAAGCLRLGRRLFSEELAEAAGRKADVVVDNVGEATWNQSMRSLAPEGRLAVCGATSGGKVELPLTVLFYKQLEIIGSTMFDHSRVRRGDGDGGFRSGEVPIDIVFPLRPSPRGPGQARRGRPDGEGGPPSPTVKPGTARPILPEPAQPPRVTEVDCLGTTGAW